jgi:Rieske Fe-S protein
LLRLKQSPSAMYHFVADRIARPSADIDRVVSGQGALVEYKGRRLAVYRDNVGQLHVMSPVCRHLKCIVDWNGEDKTWDCPCHGSRYDAYGVVIQGPARKNLLPDILR